MLLLLCVCTNLGNGGVCAGVGVEAAAAAGVALVGSLEVEGVVVVVVVVGCCCCSSPRRRVRCSNLCSRMRCASGSASVVVVVVDADEG